MPVKRMWEKYPDRILRNAVMGMLPKNKLRESMIKKLKLVSGPEHQFEVSLD